MTMTELMLGTVGYDVMSQALYVGPNCLLFVFEVDCL